MRANVRVRFEDGSFMVYEPTSSVRIVNRGPRTAPYRDFEKVSSDPPRYVGLGSFEACILAAGHVIDSHRGLRTVVEVERDVDVPPGDPSVTAGPG